MRACQLLFLFLLVFASGVGLRSGELETKTLASAAVGREVKINVLLPDGYSNEKDRRYPVIYLLHGYGGDYTEWQKVGIVDEAKGLPAIIVMPEGDKSFYVNHHGDPKALWEDYLTREVVGYVEERYRTIARREGRAICGLSMGGYGAMVLGLRHPELFGAIASESGALGVPGWSTSGEIGDRLTHVFGPEDSPQRRDYDLKRLLRDLPAEKRPDLYLDCGSEDILLESNRAFVAELAKQKAIYEYREVPGAHNYPYWKRNVRAALDHQLAALAKVPEAGAVAAKKAGEGKPEEKGAGILGDWALTLEVQGSQREYTLRLLEKEKQLTAVVISPRSGEHPAKSVSFKDGAIRFEVDREIQGQEVTLIYQGKLSEKGLSGSVTLKDLPDFTGTWSAKREKKPQEL
jgi:S-formylglutathione hydrolase FrmB